MLRQIIDNDICNLSSYPLIEYTGTSKNLVSMTVTSVTAVNYQIFNTSIPDSFRWNPCDNITFDNTLQFQNTTDPHLHAVNKSRVQVLACKFIHFVCLPKFTSDPARDISANVGWQSADSCEIWWKVCVLPFSVAMKFACTFPKCFPKYLRNDTSCSRWGG